MKSHDPIVNLFKKSTLTILIGMILISLIMGAITVYPFYTNLIKASNEEFGRFSQSLNHQVQSYISGITNIALQVTSRTKARNTLVEYNNGEVDFKTANKIIGDILTDVPRRSPIVLGITRFGINGMPISTIGQKLPENFPDSSTLSKSEIHIHTKFQVDQQPILIIDVPIKDRNNQRVGNDVILFQTLKLETLIKNSATHYAGSSLSLGYQSQSEIHPLYIAGNHNLSDESEKTVIHAFSFKNSNLYLSVAINKNELYALPNAEVIRMMGLMVSVLFLGCLGIYILGRKSLKNMTYEIHQREIREKELHQQNEILDNIGAYVYMKDLQGKYIYANKSVCDLFECSLDEIIGYDDSKFFSLEMSDDLKINDQKVLKHGEKIISEERNIIAATKEERYYTSVKQPLKNLEGNIEGMFGVSTDITKLKRMEKELHELNQNLRERVESEITKQQKQEQLLLQKSKMAAMGEMIGAIAHQLKQPLNTINLYAQSISDIVEFDNQDNEKLLKIEQNIVDQVEHMDKTVSDFRNFFKPSEFETAFDVCDLVNDVYRLVKEKMKKLNVELIVNKQNCFKVKGLPNELKHVILNIYNNACDVFEERNITDRKIELFFEKNAKNRAIMRIRDTGGGILEELLPDKIFESYVSTKGEKGTGIGLQISKIIVEEKFQGKFYAKNWEQGAEFVIEVSPLS